MSWNKSMIDKYKGLTKLIIQGIISTMISFPSVVSNENKGIESMR
jgi:hypothetical protein